MKPALFRRRQVWLPTLWGWLLLLLVLAVVGTVLVRQAYDLLAPTRPARGADGSGAKTLVIEGWLSPPDIQQAAALIRSGRYERVITTGGPIEPWVDVGDWGNYALRAAARLRATGNIPVPIVPVPAPASAQDRTYLSAVMVREWANANHLAPGAIDLYSAGVHARRSWLLYRMAFGDDREIGVFAAYPTDFDPQRWWTTSNGVKSTLGEVISLSWTQCCFWPPARGSHEERWAVPPSASASATAAPK